MLSLPFKQNQTMGKEITAIMIALKFVPRPNDFNKSFWVAFSFVGTRKVPITEQRMPETAINSGTDMAFNGMFLNAATPNAMEEMTEPT